MSSVSQRLQTMTAVLCGAYAVHQLRYFVGYRSDAQAALSEQGHAYLAQIACPMLGSLVALAIGHGLWSLARARPGRGQLPYGRLAVLSALALTGIYCVQEVLEGALVADHPAGLAGVLGAGGWVAFPLAAAGGLLIAWLLRQADAVLQRARTSVALPPSRPVPGLSPIDIVRVPARGGLGRHIGGRGPPTQTV